jgi:hypothetical protein
MFILQSYVSNILMFRKNDVLHPMMATNLGKCSVKKISGTEEFRFLSAVH